MVRPDLRVEISCAASRWATHASPLGNLIRYRKPDREVKKVFDTVFVECTEAFEDDDMRGYVRALLLQDVEDDGVIPGLGRLPVRRNFIDRSGKRVLGHKTNLNAICADVAVSPVALAPFRH